jgi:hypothetical protein
MPCRRPPSTSLAMSGPQPQRAAPAVTPQQIRNMSAANRMMAIARTNRSASEVNARLVVLRQVSPGIHTVGPRLFEPKSLLPGNGISPAETKASKPLRKTKEGISET